MILTFHLLFGAAIIAKIKIIPLAFFLCILSHYFLDFLPHYDFYSVDDITDNIESKDWQALCLDFLKMFLDFCFAVFLIYLLSEDFLLSFLGAITTEIPDVLCVLSFFFPQNKIFKTHRKFHDEVIHSWKSKKVPLFWKLFNDFLVFSVSLLLLIF